MSVINSDIFFLLEICFNLVLASLGHSDFNFMAEKRNSLSRLEGKQVVLGGRPGRLPF